MNDDDALDLGLPANNADLETILAAWHAATVRLEQTHESLRAEVRRLTDELEVKNRELARKNRLADLGQMASHIAHEVRNNLVPLTLYLSLLRRRIQDDPGSVEVLDKVEASFAELDVTVNDLLHFTQDRDPHLETFALKPMVEDVAGSLAPQFAAQEIGTFIEMADNLRVTADRNMVRRAALEPGAQCDRRHAQRRDAHPLGGLRQWRRRVEGDGHGTGTVGRSMLPRFRTVLYHEGRRNGPRPGNRAPHCRGPRGEVSGVNAPSGGAVFTLSIPYPAREAAA